MGITEQLVTVMVVLCVFIHQIDLRAFWTFINVAIQTKTSSKETVAPELCALLFNIKEEPTWLSLPYNERRQTDAKDATVPGISPTCSEDCLLTPAERKVECALDLLFPPYCLSSHFLGELSAIGFLLWTEGA